jgi:hypothetical protein
MMKEEFEKIAGAKVSLWLYEEIEREYTRENEDKYAFIGRIFGRKNTTKSVAVKYASLIVHQYIDDLSGRYPPDRLREMVGTLLYRVNVRVCNDFVNGRYRYVNKWDFDLLNARLNGQKVFAWLDELKEGGAV